MGDEREIVQKEGEKQTSSIMENMFRKAELVNNKAVGGIDYLWTDHDFVVDCMRSIDSPWGDIRAALDPIEHDVKFISLEVETHFEDYLKSRGAMAKIQSVTATVTLMQWMKLV